MSGAKGIFAKYRGGAINMQPSVQSLKQEELDDEYHQAIFDAEQAVMSFLFELKDDIDDELFSALIDGLCASIDGALVAHLGDERYMMAVKRGTASQRRNQLTETSSQ